VQFLNQSWLHSLTGNNTLTHIEETKPQS
jgi:hypothetical protein